jgi:uncharacterized protein (DUF1778 family)
MTRPDPASPEESAVINAAIKHAVQAIGQARRAVLGVRPSDEYALALDALGAAQRSLQAIIEREG